MKTLKILSLFALFIFAFSACNNDDNTEPEPEPAFVQIDQYTKKHKNGVVEVSYAPVDITLGYDGEYAYYSFDKMGFIKPVDPKTDNWDIVFTSRLSLNFAPYAAVACHYGKASNNSIPWATGTDDFNVTGGFILKTFDELETVPTDLTYSMNTKTGILVGIAAFDDPNYLIGASGGYYVNSTETGDPLYYAKYTNKCHIVKLNDGRFVKFDFINIYNNKPEDNNKDSQKGFLSFRYFIAKAGSTDVKTN